MVLQCNCYTQSHRPTKIFLRTILLFKISLAINDTRHLSLHSFQALLIQCFADLLLHGLKFEAAKTIHMARCYVYTLVPAACWHRQVGLLLT